MFMIAFILQNLSYIIPFLGLRTVLSQTFKIPLPPNQMPRLQNPSNYISDSIYNSFEWKYSSCVNDARKSYLFYQSSYNFYALWSMIDDQS